MMARTVAADERPYVKAGLGKPVQDRRANKSARTSDEDWRAALRNDEDWRAALRNWDGSAGTIPHLAPRVVNESVQRFTQRNWQLTK
jgi:hypothetical protein